MIVVRVPGDRHALTVVFAIVLMAGLIAGCAGGAGPGGGHSPPAGRTGPAVVSVSCRDASTDASMLQQAINASPVGSTILIGGRVCLLTRGLTLLADRSYAGGCMTGTVLRQDAPMAAVLASSSYVSNDSTTGGPLAIRDLTVRCDGKGQTDGIILVNWLVDVEHVRVGDCGGSGIVDSSVTADGSAITNTSVNSRFDDNFISDSGQYGFYVRDPRNAVTDGYLADNQIATSGADAVHLDNAAGWTVTGNNIYGVGQNAIYANRLYGSAISGNYIEDFGSAHTSGSWYGIEATAQGSIGSTITGNRVFCRCGGNGATTHVAIGITRVNSGTSYLAVSGNVVIGSGAGIGLLLSAGANRLIAALSGNVIVGVTTLRRQVGNVSVTAGT